MVYGSKAVKHALISSQHGKCAFCESRITVVSHGDVEHYRPKAGWDQEDGAGLVKPGYYWLAYDWNNLFLSCQICNQSCKRNIFPLINPASRARSHKDRLGDELPMLIHPGEDDPEKLIGWRGSVPRAIGGDPRARATIRILRLDRPELRDARREHLDQVMRDRQMVKDVADLLKRGVTLSRQVIDNVAAMREQLEAATQPHAVYSAMVRANL